MVKIGTPAAAQVLMENLLERDTTLRFRIISALNKLQRLHPGIETDALTLETVLAAEILGHYRSYQILDKLGIGAGARTLWRAPWRNPCSRNWSASFRLLGLLYPHLDVHSAYVGLQSKSVSVHDNALEFLDNVLKPQLREMLVPLLDGKITVNERARMGGRVVHTTIENQEQAVAALVASDDPWLRSCALMPSGPSDSNLWKVNCAACLNDTDPLLRDTPGPP